MHISYGIATCIRISWQCRPQSRGTNPLSLSKIQYSRCGSSTRHLACRQLVPSLESRLGRSSNSYGLLGVGEGVDRTGLARVGEAARHGPYGTGRVLRLEGIVSLSSLLRGGPRSLRGADSVRSCSWSACRAGRKPWKRSRSSSTSLLTLLLTPSPLMYPSSRSHSSPRWSRGSPPVFHRQSHGRAQTKSC